MPTSPAAAGYALQLCGAGRDDIDRVKMTIDDPNDAAPGPRIDVGATDFTLEFWMLASPGRNQTAAVTCGENSAWIFGNIIVDRDRYDQDREYGLSMAGGVLVFGVRGDGGDPLTICGSTVVDDAQWHHVALTRERETGAMRLFVDGRVDAAATSGPTGDISYPDDGVPGVFCGGPCLDSDPYLVFGAEKHDVGRDYPPFTGLLDEIRLSTVVRYSAPFERPTAPFAPDSLTVGLWHLDEGTGATATDTSPNGQSHGEIRVGGPRDAPRWVVSSAPLG